MEKKKKGRRKGVMAGKIKEKEKEMVSVRRGREGELAHQKTGCRRDVM